MILEKVPIACVDGAVLSEGAVLLLRRLTAPAAGKWWLPGGRVLKNETLRDAVVRKVYEETGLLCVAGDLIHTGETIFSDGPNGISSHTINQCFLMYPSSGQLKLDENHEGVWWIRAMKEYVFHPYIRACLVAAGIP